MDLECTDNNLTDQSSVELSTIVGITGISIRGLPNFRGSKAAPHRVAHLFRVGITTVWRCVTEFCAAVNERWRSPTDVNAACLEVGPARFGLSPEMVHLSTTWWWKCKSTQCVWLGTAKSASGKAPLGTRLKQTLSLSWTVTSVVVVLTCGTEEPQSLSFVCPFWVWPCTVSV